MPSKRIANSIRMSLAPGEVPADAEVLFDSLLILRSRLNLAQEENEQITGALLCFLFPAKPTRYRKDMQEFRKRFAGISNDSSKLDQFRSRVLPQALTLDETDLSRVEWDSKLYFVREEEAEGSGILIS